MSSLEIEDTPMSEYEDPVGVVPAGHGVYLDHNLIGTIDLDAANNWCAYPLDAPPLTSAFTDRWDAALAIARARKV